MKPKLVLMVALVLIGGWSAFGSTEDIPVTPQSLDQGQLFFSISTRPAPGGTAFHVIVTSRTGSILSDSSVYLCLITTSKEGGAISSSMELVTPEPRVTLHKDDHVWKADFTASSEFLKNPDVYLVFDVISHVMINGKSEPMPSADDYEVKLRDFLKP